MTGVGVLRSICFFPLILFVIACTGTPEPVGAMEDITENQKREYSTWQDLRRPIVGELDLPPAEEIVPPPLPAPSWMPARLPWWVWLPQDSTESPLFLGTSFPRVSRTEELKQCIRNAARQAAQYAGIAARVSSFRGSFREGTGYAEDIQLQYSENLVPDFIREAELRTLYQDETGSYALIRFPSLISDTGTAESPDINVLTGFSEPEWISRLPDIQGYYLGLGVSRPRVRFADSIAEADKAALAEILFQLAAEVEVSYDVKTGEGTGSSFYEDVYQFSSATVKGLQIIARWRNPEGSYF